MPIAFLPSVPARYDPNLSRHKALVDVSPAQKFAPTRLLAPLGTRPDDASIDTAARLIRDKMKSQYVPGHDYIVAIGDPVLIGIAFMTAAQLSGNVGKLRTLRWDRDRREYTEMVIDLKACNTEELEVVGE